ncbi:MAG: dTDP-4-dehydrorhamnose reductase [Hyphomicrobiaceae bacterium]
MRLLITGWHGQVARSLATAAARNPRVETLAVGRPALDLVRLPTILRSLSDARPDIVINTAAYTAVDKAEDEPEAAAALNHEGAALLARATAERGIPIIHLSTDYVFDGTKVSAYVEDDPPHPLSVYGRTKRDGEIAVAAGNDRHVIVRTAWVYSPFGQNFVRTMLRLARERDAVRVVEDQIGSPTYAPHLADLLLDLAARLLADPPGGGYGVFHAAGAGETSWADFAEAVFARSGQAGGPTAAVERIPTSGYPTRAARPANSRLDCAKLARVYGLRMPDWHEGLADCVPRLLAEPDA